MSVLDHDITTLAILTVLLRRGLDFTPVNDSNMPPDTPIIVVMHGLTGGTVFFVTPVARRLKLFKVHMNPM